MRLFLDSDVIISSLNSSTGASFQLLETSLDKFISNYSARELEIVVERLSLDLDQLRKILSTKVQIVTLLERPDEILKRYELYINDPFDSHIIAGAVAAQAQYLITYNMKDYKIDKIKEDFKIITMRPGEFLQFLRSS
ncbi:putative toxin-antitoxin system toxin component, PIN family [Candidatus Roizmanbacteria bacterium]|nr:putative toxin-antitoxin system toxin component, PIN family [Candidatus Roizmanbacteria bacterium]